MTLLLKKKNEKKATVMPMICCAKLFNDVTFKGRRGQICYSFLEDSFELDCKCNMKSLHEMRNDYIRNSRAAVYWLEPSQRSKLRWCQWSRSARHSSLHRRTNREVSSVWGGSSSRCGLISSPASAPDTRVSTGGQTGKSLLYEEAVLVDVA